MRMPRCSVGASGQNAKRPGEGGTLRPAFCEFVSGMPYSSALTLAAMASAVMPNFS
jgi:hypothetical protein